jgi:hypothetical protein
MKVLRATMQQRQYHHSTTTTTTTSRSSEGVRVRACVRY